jgi:hypothetical protein
MPAAASKIVAAASQALVRQKLLQIEFLVMASFPGRLGGCGAPVLLPPRDDERLRDRLICVYRHRRSD